MWSDDATLMWDVEASAATYNIYRGELANLGFDHYGDCRNDLDGNLADTQLIDGETPSPGGAFFYTIASDSGGSKEGTTGVGTCAERSGFSACP